MSFKRTPRVKNPKPVCRCYRHKWRRHSPAGPGGSPPLPRAQRRTPQPSACAPRPARWRLRARAHGGSPEGSAKPPSHPAESPAARRRAPSHPPLPPNPAPPSCTGPSAGACRGRRRPLSSPSSHSHSCLKELPAPAQARSVTAATTSPRPSPGLPTHGGGGGSGSVPALDGGSRSAPQRPRRDARREAAAPRFRLASAHGAP